jgi:hypothetical protein
MCTFKPVLSVIDRQLCLFLGVTTGKGRVSRKLTAFSLEQVGRPLIPDSRCYQGEPVIRT